MSQGSLVASALPHDAGIVPRASVQPLVGLLVLAFLGFASPAWLYSELPARSSIEPSALLALLLLEYSALRLAWLAWRGEPRLMAMTFYVFVYIWGGLSAFAQNAAWTYPWPKHHHPPEAELALLQIALAVLAYDLGQWTVRVHQARRSAWKLDISLKATFWICVASVPLAVAGMVMLGGPEVLFTTRGEFYARANAAADSKALSLIGQALLRSPPFIAFVLVCVVCLRQWRSMSRPARRLFLLLILVTGALNVVCNYPLSLARYWLGTIGLTPVFALLAWRQRSWWIGGISVALAATMIFVFPYADAFRNAREGSDFFKTLDRALKTEVVRHVTSKGDFDVYQMTINAMVVADRNGYSWGRNFAGAALFWFPRSLWQGKPLGTGHLVGLELRYKMINLSAPLWTECYWAFGWIGVAILMWLYGHGSALLDRGFILYRLDPSRLTIPAIAAPFLAAYQFIALRGDLLNVIALSSVTVLLFMLTARIGPAAATRVPA